MYEAINRSGFHGLRSMEREANLFNLEMPALHCSDEGAILERQIVGGGLLFEGQYWIAIAVENPSSGPPQPRASLRQRERVPGPCEAEVGVGGRCWRAIKGGRPCRARRGRHSGRWSCRLRRGRRMRLGSGGGWARTERVGPVGGRRWSLSRRRRRRRHRRRRPRWKRKGGGYN